MFGRKFAEMAASLRAKSVQFVHGSRQRSDWMIGMYRPLCAHEQKGTKVGKAQRLQAKNTMKSWV
jgi:hypothetical protein